MYRVAMIVYMAAMYVLTSIAYMHVGLCVINLLLWLLRRILIDVYLITQLSIRGIKFSVVLTYVIAMPISSC